MSRLITTISMSAYIDASINYFAYSRANHKQPLIVLPLHFSSQLNRRIKAV